MKHQTLPTIAKLSASGLLAVLIAACGSSGSDDNNAAAQSSAAAQASSSTAASTSSEAMMSSSEMASSSSVPVAADPVVPFSIDFESVAPGVGAMPDEFNISGSGLEVVEGEGAYSGNIALKATSTNKSSGFLTLDNFSATHWGRLYYKNISKPATLNTYAHTTLVAAYGGNTQYRLVDMVAAPDTSDNKDKYQHLYNIDNTQNIDISLEGPYSHSYGNEWVCLEWQVSAVDQEYHVYFNGDELALANQGVASNSTDLVNAKRWDGEVFDFVPLPSSFEQLKIGIQNYQDGLTYSFLLDDIAVAETRVGCEITEEGSSSSAMSSEAASSSAPAVVVGKADFDLMCKSCHTGAPAGLIGGRDQATLSAYINGAMPKGNPSACEDTCADEVASYILK